MKRFIRIFIKFEFWFLIFPLMISLFAVIIDQIDRVFPQKIGLLHCLGTLPAEISSGFHGLPVESLSLILRVDFHYYVSPANFQSWILLIVFYTLYSLFSASHFCLYYKYRELKDKC